VPGTADERTGGQLQATCTRASAFRGNVARREECRYTISVRKAKLQQPLRIQANRRHVPASSNTNKQRGVGDAERSMGVDTTSTCSYCCTLPAKECELALRSRSQDKGASFVGLRTMIDQSAYMRLRDPVRTPLVVLPLLAVCPAGGLRLSAALSSEPL
jgi:hypothetical protein